jgi:hypothetical protein
MGFKEGGGLGKHGQGRTAPVEASKHKGRRGLGAVIADVDRGLINYDNAHIAMHQISPAPKRDTLFRHRGAK